MPMLMIPKVPSQISEGFIINMINPTLSTTINDVQSIPWFDNEEKKVEPAKTKNENKTKSSPKSTLKVSKKK